MSDTTNAGFDFKTYYLLQLLRSRQGSMLEWCRISALQNRLHRRPKISLFIGWAAEVDIYGAASLRAIGDR